MEKSPRQAVRTRLLAGNSSMVLGSILACSVIFISLFISSPQSALADDSSTATSTNPTLSFAFSIPVTSPTGDDPLPVTATFSQPVTGFQASSLNIALGSVTDFTQVSPTEYTFNIVENAPQGSVSIDSNDPNVKNTAGLVAIAAPQLNVVYDSSLSDTIASSSATSIGSVGSTASSTSSTNSSNSSSTSTTTAPWIEFLSGPADGSTIATSTATFTFQTDGSSTISCSFGSDAARYGCGSPQTFTNLVDGTYPFTVYAAFGTTTASTTSTFIVDLENASSATGTSTDATASSTDDTSSTTDSTATTTDSTSSYSASTAVEFSGGGTSGQMVDSPESGILSSEADDDTSGGGSGSTSLIPDGTYVPGVAGNAGDEYTDGYSNSSISDSDNGDLAFNTIEENDATSSSSSSAALYGDDDTATDTNASTSQAAAAGLTSVSATLVWGSLLILILLLLGGGYWYSQRRTS